MRVCILVLETAQKGLSPAHIFQNTHSHSYAHSLRVSHMLYLLAQPTAVAPISVDLGGFL